MARMVLGESMLESLTPSVNARLDLQLEIHALHNLIDLPNTEIRDLIVWCWRIFHANFKNNCFFFFFLVWFSVIKFQKLLFANILNPPYYIKSLWVINNVYIKRLLKFVGLALVGKDIVFRFIIEYSNLREFGPWVVGLFFSFIFL
jgi:hypothetical protein